MTRRRLDPGELADLDAGLLDAAHAARVRSAAAGDPRAAAVLDALAATRAELAAQPAPPVPAEFAARWAAALDDAWQLDRPQQPDKAPQPDRAPDPDRAQQIDRPQHPDQAPQPERLPQPDRAPDPDRAQQVDRPQQPDGARTHGCPPRPDRPQHPDGRRALNRIRPAARPGSPSRRPAIAAAGLLVALVAAGVLWPGPASPPARDVLAADVDLATAGRDALGSTDLGALADPVRRAGCLRALAPSGVAPDAVLLGGREVQRGGRPGVLLVLGTGELGVFRVLVVDPGCGPGRGDLLESIVVGG